MRKISQAGMLRREIAGVSGDERREARGGRRTYADGGRGGGGKGFPGRGGYVERKPGAGIEISRYLSAGLTWALSTLLFMLAGAWVGERLGSRPIGAVAGAFVGGAAGFYWLVRQLISGPGRRDGE